MTGLVERASGHDTETPDTIQARFAIEFLDENRADATAVMSMPMSGLRNPFTGAPTIGPLAILVDAAGGMVNHYRRRADRWTVSSELSVELSPGSIDGMESPVVASARTVGSVGSSSLAVCTLRCDDIVVGGASVRSFFIPAEGIGVERLPEEERNGTRSLAELMAVRIRDDHEGMRVLEQHIDPNLNNEIGIMHGGVAAAGLELVASAAVNDNPAGGLLRTASLRVNFLRPFIAGRDSRYVGTALRVGRNTAVGDAQAINDDGTVAINARVTAYR
jgi:uncharacterized protein (TIGR00369 family)